MTVKCNSCNKTIGFPGPMPIEYFNIKGLDNGIVLDDGTRLIDHAAACKGQFEKI